MMLCVLLVLSVSICTTFGATCCRENCDCEDGVVSCEFKNLLDLPDCPSIDLSTYREMQLSSNNIRSPTFSRLPANIQTLVLYNNSITSVTIDRERRSITKLDLKGNSLTAVPDLSLLPSLQYLDVSGNPIPTGGYHESVLRQLGSNLTSLHIGHPTMMTEFPPLIGTHLPKLETLEINEGAESFTRLAPTAFSAFKLVLKNLTIRNTHLYATPLALKTLQGLTHLYFEGNPIMDYGLISESFKGLNNLKVLSLRNDGLTKFPEIVNSLTSLTTLILDHNKLIYITEAAFNMINGSNISVLSLKGCDLDRIPGAIADDRGNYLEQITEMDLSENNIKSIDRNDLHHLKHLQKVHLEKNPLKYISEKAFKYLPDLEFIDLSDTNLKSIPVALTNLQKNGLDIRLDRADIECTCDLVCIYRYFRDHGFTVSGSCETITRELSAYLNDIVPQCPPEAQIC